MSLTVGVAITLAQQALDRGDNAGAVEHLRDALTEAPEEGSAHALLALALLQTGRLKAARHEAEQATALAPELPFAHTTAASVALAERRLGDAERSVQAAVSLDAEDALARLLQAQLHRARRRPKESLAAIDKAIALAPGDADIRLAKAWIALDLNDVETAESLARAALAEQADNPEALSVMGRVHLRRGETAAAREHALWALQSAPHDADAIALLAAAKMRANPLTGLWWRYNAWMARRGQTAGVLIVLGAFVLYRFGVVALTEAGYGDYALGLTLLWLLLVIYSWSGGAIMERMIASEMKQVRLKPTF